MGGNRNSIIGFTLLFLLWIAYVWFNTPSAEDQKAYQQKMQAFKDSLAMVDSLNNVQDSIAKIKVDSLAIKEEQIKNDSSLTAEVRDSLLADLNKELKTSTVSEDYGSFTAAAACEGELIELENDKLKLTFDTKGGRIVDVELKDYLAYDFSTKDNNNDKTPVHLLNNKQDQFNYFIPIKGAKGGVVETQKLCFQPTLNATENTVIFRAYTDNSSQYIEQKYVLSNDGYLIDYDLKLEGLGDLLSDNSMLLNWHTYLNKIEKNPTYERRMSSIHYKEVEGNPNYCTCASDAEAELEKSVEWLSHTQQFFNTSLMVKGENRPSSAKLATFMMDEDSTHLKELISKVSFPIAKGSNVYDMQLYLGPNEYNTLKDLDVGLERIIPFGWSIFGVISRHVIRPLFNFFASFVPSYGLIIILLTLLIRLAMFPLQFNMLKSSVKMSILRPRLDAMKKKYKGDQQAMQMEQMKMYQEYGVSPLGGCLPMLLTMPIWIALYRFFPASIEFRQKGFLWADDLVSYDSIWDFGYVPFIYDIYGDHVSLFTLLWSISMFAYLIYNSKQMDMTAGNPNAKMMKYMQFAFPVIFFFALNSWAAGLTCYMLFSNLFNIGQTFLVKNVLINKDKLEKEMDKKREEQKKNPKKKNRWQQMMEEARKQQELQKKNKNK
jgi:YidC/Oxa1 family membrane protein insertase